MNLDAYVLSSFLVLFVLNFLFVQFCVVLGDGESQKGYRCYNPITHKLYVTHHVIFIEHIPFFFIQSNSSHLHKSKVIYIVAFPANVLIDTYVRDMTVSDVPSSSDLSIIGPPIVYTYGHRTQLSP